MANHVRKQLRAAVTSAVTNLTTTGARVYGWRVYALQAGSELPALCVYITEEEAESVTVHAPALVERRPVVHVRGFASASADVEDTLDTIAKEVETALASGVTVGAKTVTLEYIGCEIEASEGDKPIGTIDLRFAAILHNTANAPDSLT